MAVEVGGQTPTSGAVLALVVDVLAVLAALVVIGCGRKIEQIEAATALAEREAIEANRRAVEAERAAEQERRLAAEQAEADRAERERLAVIEAEREASELERARIEAETETNRRAAAEAEAERVEREREAAEASAEADRAAAARELLEARTASESTTSRSGTGDKATTSRGKHGGDKPARRGDTSEAIAAFLALNPQATQAEVAMGIGVSAKTVQRSPIWQNHRTAREAEQATNAGGEAPHLEIAQ